MAIARTHFQDLARCRIEDAKALLKRKRWDAAYYLAGYSIECALKSCIIASLVRSDSWFPTKRYSEDCFTHNLVNLCKLAGLDVEISVDVDVYRNWLVVKDWTEQSRYEIARSEVDAKNLLQAITQKRQGVLIWLQKRW